MPLIPAWFHEDKFVRDSKEKGKRFLQNNAT